MSAFPSSKAGAVQNVRRITRAPDRVSVAGRVRSRRRFSAAPAGSQDIWILDSFRRLAR